MKLFTSARCKLALMLVSALAIPLSLSNCGGGSDDSSDANNTRPQTLDGLTLFLDQNMVEFSFIRSAVSIADPSAIESGAVNYNVRNGVKFFRPRVVAPFLTIGNDADPVIEADEEVSGTNGGLDVTWPTRVGSATYTYQPSGPTSGRLTITSNDGSYLFNGADAPTRTGIGQSNVQLYYFAFTTPRRTHFDLTFNASNNLISNVVAIVSPEDSFASNRLNLVNNNPGNSLFPYRLRPTVDGQLDVTIQSEIRITETSRQVETNYTLIRNINEPSPIATHSLDGLIINNPADGSSYSFTKTGGLGAVEIEEIGNATLRTPDLLTNTFTTSDAGEYTYRTITGTDNAILTFEKSGQSWTLTFTSSATDSSEAAGTFSILYSNGTTTTPSRFTITNPEINL